MRVTGDDYSRLGEQAESMVRFEGTRAYMRMQDGHCAALSVDVDTGQFVCTAYATRPQVCRDLERGESACQAEREAKAQRPLLALRRARG